MKAPVPLAAVLLAVALSAAPHTGAQVPTFKTQTDVVHLWVSVRDSKGEPVTDLTREDFTLLDDGKRQSIDLFGRQGDEGWKALNEVDAVLVLDTSERMLFGIQQARAAALAFIDKLPSNIVLYDGPVAARSAAVADHESRRRWLDQRAPGGASALYDGISSTLERLEPSSRRRIFVALTDGFDQRSRIGVGDLTRELQMSGAIFYGVQFTRGFSGAKLDELSTAHAAMRTLAEATGGLVIRSESVPTELLLDEVLADVESQYVLGFVPGRGHKLRRLKVTVNRAGLKARHRVGYLPPSPQ